MTTLRRKRTIRCPYVRAIAYFDRYLSGLPAADGSDARVLRLRAPLSALGLPDGLALDRDVDARFATSEEPRGLEHGVSVEWMPRGGGPYPSFHGALSIVADTPKSSDVVLDGAYEPPLGAVGQAFDAAVGKRIADATADELLRVIADRIENDYMTEEPHISR